MSLGNSVWSILTGGGQVRQTAQAIARAIVHLDVSPLATVNALIPLGGDPSQIPGKLDVGRGAEMCAFTARNGQPQYFMAVNPSVAGALSSVTLQGTSAATITPSAGPHKSITIKCITSGALGTMQIQTSLDGGVTYGPVVTSASSWSSTGYRIPGTFVTLTFAAGSYVATKTNVVGIDGTVTPGSGWVGTVAIASASPVDDFEVIVTVLKAGAVGTAVIQVSLDNGNTSLAPMLVPSGGVVTLPNTGIYLTCSSSSGNFNAGETYSFLTIGPGFSTSDLNTALTALKAIRTLQVSLIHIGNMPVSAAGAFSQASTLDTAILDGFNNNIFDWQGVCNCPSNKGGMRITSPITGRKHLRPLSWLLCERYVETDPKDELAATKPAAQTATGDGSLHVFLPPGSQNGVGPGDIVIPSSTPLYDTADTDAVILAARGSDLTRTSVCVGGRDEFINPGLDDVQINTARSYGGPLKMYLSITAGVAGWKNLTTNTSYVDAGALRALNVMIAALRPVAQGLLGQRPKVNSDGTISETAARGFDTLLDGAVKRAMGLVPGGDFSDPQCSAASARVLRSSQLGAAPKRLDISYTFQPLGEVTSEQNTVQFAGVLSLS